MADKISRIAPTGNMDKDSDVRYIGKGNNAGDYLDARNIQAVDQQGNVQGSIPPTLGNEFAFSIGEVSQQNKRFRITFDGDVTKQHELRFLSTQRDANMVVGTGIDGALTFNGTQSDFISQFNIANSGSGISFLVTTPTATTVEIELSSYPMYQWFLDSVGTDDVNFTVIQEAIPVDLSGPLKDIGSYDLLGDLFIFSTTQDDEPSVLSAEVIGVGPVSGGALVGNTTLLYNAPHGLVAGQWIRITGSEAPWLNGLFVVNQVLSTTQIEIITVLAWGGTQPLFTVGSEQTFVNPIGIGEIGVAQKNDNNDTWTYTRLLRSIELNFVSKWQIDVHGHLDASGRNLYYTDDYNQPRRFRYRSAYVEDGSLNFIEPLNEFVYELISALSALSPPPPSIRFSFIQQLQNGGQLISGNKYYVARLVYTGGDSSPWSTMSRAIPVYKESLSSSEPSDVRGSSGVTSKRNQILIEGEFIGKASKIEVAVIEDIDGAISGTIFRQLEISSNSITVTHSGNEAGSKALDLSQIAVTSESFIPIKAKSIRSIDSRNVLSNIETLDKIDLSDWVRTFRHSIKRKVISEATGFQKGEYQVPITVFNDMGFMLNETYRVGCRAYIRGVGRTDVFWVDDIRVDANPSNISNPFSDNRRNNTIPDYDLFLETVTPDRQGLLSSTISIAGLDTGSPLDPSFQDQYGIYWGPTSPNSNGWQYYSGTGSSQSEFYQNTTPPTSTSSLGALYVPYIEIEDIDFSITINGVNKSAREIVEALEFFIGDVPNSVKASGVGVFSVESPDQDTILSVSGTPFGPNAGGLVDNGAYLRGTGGGGDLGSNWLSFAAWPRTSTPPLGPSGVPYILEWPYATGSTFLEPGNNGTIGVNNPLWMDSSIAANYPVMHMPTGSKFTPRKDFISFYSGDTVYSGDEDFSGDKLIVFGFAELQNNIVKRKIRADYKNVTAGQNPINNPPLSYADRATKPASFWAKFTQRLTSNTYAEYDVNAIEFVDSEKIDLPKSGFYPLDYGNFVSQIQTDNPALTLMGTSVGADELNAVDVGGEKFSKRLPFYIAFYDDPLNGGNVTRTTMSTQKGPVIKLSTSIDDEDPLTSPSFANQSGVMRYSNRGVVCCQIYSDERENFAEISDTRYSSIGTLALVPSNSLTTSVPLNCGDTYTQSTVVKHRSSDMNESDLQAAIDSGVFPHYVNLQQERVEDFVREVFEPGFNSGMVITSQNRINANLFTSEDVDSPFLVPYSKNGGADGWLYSFGYESQPKYNPAYNRLSAIDLQAFFNPTLLGGARFDFPVRIMYSLRKDEQGIFDEYRIFQPLNIKDLDYTFGEIIHHENVNGELFTLQLRKWQMQLFNTRGELQVSGSAIGVVIGDGSVLSRDGQTLSLYGTQHKWSCHLAKSEGGKDVIVWYNAENGLFMRFGADGTLVISNRNNFRSYANKAAKWLRGKDTPAFDQGIRCVWDDRSKEVIWTFTGWRVVSQAWISGAFVEVGEVVTNTNAPFDTYENIPRFFKCKTAHSSTPSDEPGVGSNWQTYWDQIPYDNFDYYSVFTVAFNEATNGFKTFYGHIPKTYLKWQDTFLSSHPINRNLIFEHRRGLPTTWYGVDTFATGDIDPKVEDAYVEMVINELPEQSTRGVAVRHISENVPDRVDYRTKRHHTWDEAAQFTRFDDQWIAPIRNDATQNNDPTGDGAMLSGEYLRVKFTIFGGTYNLLHSIIVKFLDRARRIKN